MLLWLNGIFVVLFSVICALLVLVFVRRIPAARHLSKTNDIVGYYSAVLGTIYAVILAFMFFAVWNRFEIATDLVDQEANAALDIYRLAPGLPAPLDKELQEKVQTYVNTVVEREWPAIAQGESLVRLGTNADDLFDFITHQRPTTEREQEVFDTISSRFIELSKYRRDRFLRAEATLSPLLWAMLIVGGLILVLFMCLFGVDSFRLHALKTTLLTAMIALILYVIAELSQPFQGSVQIQPTGFRVAQGQFERLTRKWALASQSLPVPNTASTKPEPQKEK